MPHINTGHGQHDPTASAYVVRIDGSEPRITLHLHRKLGTYMQFGGHVELNENPWQAITHELLEESGYSLDKLAVLQPKMRLAKLSNATAHPMPVSYNTHPIGANGEHYHVDAVYAFVTAEEPAYKPEEGESADIRLFTRTELESLPGDRILDNVREIALFIFDGPLKDWERVPAADI